MKSNQCKGTESGRKDGRARIRKRTGLRVSKFERVKEKRKWSLGASSFLLFLLLFPLILPLLLVLLLFLFFFFFFVFPFFRNSSKLADRLD